MSKSQGRQCRRWVGTVNNPSDGIEDKIQELDALANYLVCGREVGESGTPHLQLYVAFKKPHRLTAVRKLIPGAHLEPAKGSDVQNQKYCTKDGDILIETGKPMNKEKSQRNVADKIKRVRAHIAAGTEPDILEDDVATYCIYGRQLRELIKKTRQAVNRPTRYLGAELKDWQQDLYDELQETADDRKVIWYVDIDGGHGKTWFGNYLTANCDAIVLDNGRTVDGAYLYDSERIVIFDLVKSSQDHVNYEIIEKIKNGRFNSTKYECLRTFVNSPHVVVFANTWPDKSKLSEDRWDIRPVGKTADLMRATAPPSPPCGPPPEDWAFV
jgi:hypothetical protein